MTGFALARPAGSRGAEHGGNQPEGYLIALLERRRDTRAQSRAIEICAVPNARFFDQLEAVSRPLYHGVTTAQRPMGVDRGQLDLGPKLRPWVSAADHDVGGVGENKLRA